MMNKSILILGASSDVGLELINKTHRNYETIIAHYNNREFELKRLKEQIGDKLNIIKADFSLEHETDAFIKQVEKEVIYPTNIVHLPAANVRNINFHKSDWEHVEFDINISLRSIYKIIQHFIKPMTKAKYGNIIFMLSSNTVTTPKYMLDYTIVKYALLGFMKALATEYAEKNIRVNAISPSMIETKFLENVPRLIVEQSALNNPLKRNAVVDDIVPVLEFLLSDESNYIIGQNINISGGSIIG